jgi:hypothetical protein
MSVQTKYSPLETELDLTVKDTQSSLTVRAISLALTRQDDKLIECHLTFCVNPELYQHIDKEVFFNLTPNVRTPLFGVEFLPALDIAIDTSLKPDFLPHLAEHAANIEEAEP